MPRGVCAVERTPSKSFSDAALDFTVQRGVRKILCAADLFFSLKKKRRN
jgi:hypothetical protein